MVDESLINYYRRKSWEPLRRERATEPTTKGQFCNNNKKPWKIENDQQHSTCFHPLIFRPINVANTLNPPSSTNLHNFVTCLSRSSTHSSEPSRPGGRCFSMQPPGHFFWRWQWPWLLSLLRLRSSRPYLPPRPSPSLVLERGLLEYPWIIQERQCASRLTWFGGPTWISLCLRCLLLWLWRVRLLWCGPWPCGRGQRDAERLMMAWCCSLETNIKFHVILF